MNIFFGNFNVSFYFFIIKSYVLKESENMFGLIMGGLKIIFFLFWVFVLLMMIEMKVILSIWFIIVLVDVVFFF